jgi:hypothetical protein
MDIPREGNEKVEKLDFKIWKKMAIPQEGNEKILKYATGIWNEKVEIFLF